MKNYKLILQTLGCSLALLFSSCDNDNDNGFSPVSIDTYADDINFRPIAPEFDENNPFIAVFEPYAPNAISYEVTFGDVPNEVPTILQAGESITHEFPTIGVYMVEFKAVSLSGKTGEISQALSIGAFQPYELTFEEPAVNSLFDTFNGASFSVVDNPFVSGAHPVANTKVAEFARTTAQFPGIFYTAMDASGKVEIINFSGNNKNVMVKVHSIKPVQVQVTFDDSSDGTSRGVTARVDHSGTGWELLVLDFANATTAFISGDDPGGDAIEAVATYRKLEIIIDGNSTEAGNFYIDDIMQEGF